MDTVVVDPFFTHVPAFFGLTPEALLAQKHRDAWAEFERQDIDEPTLYRRFFRDCRTIDGPGLKAHMRNAYHFVPGMEALLQELATQGVEMHALSNYPTWYTMIDARLDLRRFMELSFISCLTGVRKPDPAAYRYPCAALGRLPQDFVFIDDRKVNVDAARATGMTAVQFQGNVRDLREQLSHLLGLPGLH